MTWDTITRLGDNLYRISEPIATFAPQFGVKMVNMYLVVGKERAALIDTGTGIGDAESTFSVRAEIRKITSLPALALNSHYHWDHTGANAQFDEIAMNEIEIELYSQEPDTSAYHTAMQAPNVRAALPPDFDPDAYRIVRKPITRKLCDGDTIDLGSLTLTAIHTPGHSPGHTAFFDESSSALFTADAAYCGPMLKALLVYACFTGSDPHAFAASARRLSQLRGVKTICPGHEDIISNPNWLSGLADAVDAALDGKVQSRAVNEPMKRKEYRLGAFSVWFPL